VLITGITVGATAVAIGVTVAVVSLQSRETGIAETSTAHPGGDPVSPAGPAPRPLIPSRGDVAGPAPSMIPGAPQADPVWVAATATATGIPQRALLAYANAAIISEQTRPGCVVGWNTIAAIGFVESAHGSINGSVIGVDGVVSPAIFGPALNGTEFDAISDTDGGAVDGDSVWDRAVGPLQFIPTSWKTWGADANGDGIADPQNIDDAALGTANYLCSISGDLSESQNWIDSVWAYNGVDSYVRSVAATATLYAERAEPSGR
jgi:membrane-bound lytic murein transglycosylase B